MEEKIVLAIISLRYLGVSIEPTGEGFSLVGSVTPEAKVILHFLNQHKDEALRVVRLEGSSIEDTFTQPPASEEAHVEEVHSVQQPEHSSEETTPPSEEDPQEPFKEINPREEFALTYKQHLELDFGKENDEPWLEFALWSLIDNALQGYIQNGLGESWSDFQSYVSEPSRYKDAQLKALRNWAEAYRNRERASLRKENVSELVDEQVLWAHRAWLVELARKNPTGTEVYKVDPWLDLSPWRRIIKHKGREWGLAWRHNGG